MLRKPPPLVKISQADLDIIIARHVLFLRQRAGGKRALLANHDLTGLAFHAGNLSQADFTGSVLYEANLEKAQLDYCVFFGCDLRKANFHQASLKRADLRGATLRGAVMAGADLTDADLREGSFATYDPDKGLSFAKEKEAWSEGSEGVDLRGANMGSIKLSGAVAINPNLEDANLNNAKISHADLRGANMSGANDRAPT